MSDSKSNFKENSKTDIKGKSPVDALKNAISFAKANVEIDNQLSSMGHEAINRSNHSKLVNSKRVNPSAFESALNAVDEVKTISPSRDPALELLQSLASDDLPPSNSIIHDPGSEAASKFLPLSESPDVDHLVSKEVQGTDSTPAFQNFERKGDSSESEDVSQESQKSEQILSTKGKLEEIVNILDRVAGVGIHNGSEVEFYNTLVSQLPPELRFGLKSGTIASNDWKTLADGFQAFADLYEKEPATAEANEEGIAKLASESFETARDLESYIKSILEEFESSQASSNIQTQSVMDEKESVPGKNEFDLTNIDEKEAEEPVSEDSGGSPPSGSDGKGTPLPTNGKKQGKFKKVMKNIGIGLAVVAAAGALSWGIAKWGAPKTADKMWDSVFNQKQKVEQVSKAPTSSKEQWKALDKTYNNSLENLMKESKAKAQKVQEQDPQAKIDVKQLENTISKEKKATDERTQAKTIAKENKNQASKINEAKIVSKENRAAKAHVQSKENIFSASHSTSGITKDANGVYTLDMSNKQIRKIAHEYGMSGLLKFVLQKEGKFHGIDREFMKLLLRVCKENLGDRGNDIRAYHYWDKTDLAISGFAIINPNPEQAAIEQKGETASQGASEDKNDTTSTGSIDSTSQLDTISQIDTSKTIQPDTNKINLNLPSANQQLPDSLKSNEEGYIGKHDAAADTPVNSPIQPILPDTAAIYFQPNMNTGMLEPVPRSAIQPIDSLKEEKKQGWNSIKNDSNVEKSGKYMNRKKSE